MDHATCTFPASRDNLAIELASRAIRADAEYHLLVCATADHIMLDAEIEAALDRSQAELKAACIALAAVPTTTLAGFQAKASILLVLARSSGARPAETEDDTGLAFSLFEDIVGRTNLLQGTTLIDDALSMDSRVFGIKFN